MTSESPLGASFRTLAQLLDRKLPLHHALEQSAGICGRSKRGKAWRRIAAKVRSGVSFADALEQEDVMPDQYKALLIRAINSNHASTLLISLASHADVKTEVQKSLLNHLAPLFLLMGSTMLFGLVWSFHIIPLLQNAYYQLNSEIPMHLHPLTSMIWVVPSLLVILFVHRFFFGKSTLGTQSVHQLLDVSISLQSLAVFTASNVPLHVALGSVFNTHLKDAANPVEHGESLGSSLSSRCPVSLITILENASKTGCLEAVSLKMSKLYHRLAFARLQWLSSRLIPVLLLTCSVIAGFAIISGYVSYYGTLSEAQRVLIQ